MQRGKGCPQCGQTGYRGRVGVYELMEVTPDGIANSSTRLRKPGRNRSVFGIRARKKPGTPMVRAPMTDRCRGRKGKAA